MATKPHSYGPSCKLHSGSNAFIRRASELAETAPRLRPYFFYSSSLPIDDPLSPLPAPATSSLTSTTRVAPRPFSAYDNGALEETWQGLQEFGKKHEQVFREVDHGKERPKPRKPSRPDKLAEVPTTGEGKRSPRLAATETASPIDVESSDKPGVTPFENLPPATNEGLIGLAQPSVSSAEAVHEAKGSPVLLSEDPEHSLLVDPKPVTSEEIAIEEVMSEPRRQRQNLFHRKSSRRSTNTEDSRDRLSSKDKIKETIRQARSLSRNRAKSMEAPYGSSPLERDITGTPFLRAPSRHKRPQSAAQDQLADHAEALGARNDGPGEEGTLRSTRPESPHTWCDSPGSRHSDTERSDAARTRPTAAHHGSPCDCQERKSYVPVGLSRLHLVEMPELVMKPIYWSPVHDISSVVRGTWFYKDTMLPVESDVANQLEEGYEYMKPWSQTYADEVTSCLNIGPEAESKVVHKLWPSDRPIDLVKRPITSRSTRSVTTTKPEPLTSEEQARKDASEAAASAENRAAGTLDSKEHPEEPVRLYAKSSVIYANAKDAQILRMGQLPSVARGRKPLGPIRKGRPIGIPVVRGFDHKAYAKLHPTKKSAVAKKARAGAVASQSGVAMTAGERDACTACLDEEDRPTVTDLVLVIHGIGQKLSERVESYHFTHAINAFRRQMNVELEADPVQPWLREDLGGIMVLPVNWRSTLNLEDGNPTLNAKAKEKDDSANQYSLKDITAETIPAIRSLISDVLLDIPYYLSSHKPKMIEAVIKEANRIYRLWCSNNPGFHEAGRVHLIAHSLGSVMALDILSKQPTKLPKHLDLKGKKVLGNMFEFDTKNLFFCGSPAGFFLLLNHAPLVPRKDRAKPGTEGEDSTSDVAGEAGTYGCLAVDNIYNVMHTNDPIAYRINACVEVNYANSIQPAFVPSATSSWLQSISQVIRGKPVVPTRGSGDLPPVVARPTAVKLPSTIEMETHNFTQEEIAEKKMYLLNDNGQIDYFLSSGGGPLEIQYLNMLSAHSSYWVLQDFVRFLVLEIGRKAGRGETLQPMRAVKKVWGKK